MHCSYADITDKLGLPEWWDEAGVPRYCTFGPEQRHSVYSASEVALLEIACQSCGRHFKVAMSWGRMDGLLDGLLLESRSLSEQIEDGSIHYGDPPNSECCPAGPMMNCDDLRVVEFWRRDDRFEFVRVRELEIELPDAKEAQCQA